MFKASKAVEKLEWFYEAKKIDYDAKELFKEILLSGESDEPDLTPRNIQFVMNQITQQNRRIGEIEAKIGTELLKPKVKAEFDKLEQRIARLEEAHKTDLKFTMEALERCGLVVKKPVTDDKPSECPKHTEEDIDEITQTIRIPRAVAKKWVQNGWRAVHSIELDLAIKQALKG